MAKKNQIHNLEVREGFKPSRFLVELAHMRLSEQQPKKRTLAQRLREKLSDTDNDSLGFSKSRRSFSSNDKKLASPAIRSVPEKEKESGPSIPWRRISSVVVRRTHSFFHEIGRHTVLLFVFAALAALYGYAKLRRFKKKILLLAAVKFSLSKLKKPVRIEEAMTAISEHVWSEVPVLPRTSRQAFHSALLFIFLLAAIIAPFKLFALYRDLDLAAWKQDILHTTMAAADDFKSGAKSVRSMDIDGALADFSSAQANFAKAQQDIGEVNSVLLSLASYIPNDQAKQAANAKYILESGRLSSQLAKLLALAVEEAGFEVKRGEITRALSAAARYLEQSRGLVSEMDANLQKIDPAGLPEEYRVQFLAARDRFSALDDNADYLSATISKAIDLLGGIKDKRYLLVFQNNTEMRGSGGFIGSFALVDFRAGKLRNIEIPGGGSYDVTAGFKKRIYAPEPMRVVNPLWHFWDANWWPDWQKSAPKLAWFYENSDGPTVDGVIAFTPTVIEKLLRIIGPVQLQDADKTVIDQDNFWRFTQEKAEQKGTTTPKSIISDLFQVFKAELPGRLDQENFLPLLGLLSESFYEKHILFYFFDPELEAQVKELGWDGAIADTQGDYLMVTQTNLRGGKTDRVVDIQVDHQAEIQADGSIVDTVTITKQHSGTAGDKLLGVSNVDWVRVYVPEGSTLISADGFEKPLERFFEQADPSDIESDDDLMAEANADLDPASDTRIYRESNKTVFANWMIVKPGETGTIHFKYRLPFQLAPRVKADQSWQDRLADRVRDLFRIEQKDLLPYSLLIQKQPGAKNHALKTGVVADTAYHPVWTFPEGGDKEATINRDQYRAMLFEKD